MTLNENDNAAGVGPDSPRSPDSSVLPAANQLFYNAFLTIINEKQRRGEEPECSQAEIENELNKMKGQFEEKHPGVPFPSRKAHFQTPLQRIKSDKANGDCKKIYWDQNKQVLRLASPTAGSASSSSSNQQQQQHDQQHPQQVTPTITTTFMPNAFLPTQASFVDASALHRSGATTTTTTTTDITTVPVISGSPGPNNNTNINFINYSANSNNNNNNNNSTSGNNNNSSNNNNSKLSNNNNASSFTGVVQVSVGSASPAQSAPGGSVFMRNTKPSGPYYFILALETLRDNENMHKVKLDDIKRVLRDKFWSDIQRTHADSNFPKFCVTTPAGSVRKGERLLGLEVLYDKETDTYELPHNQTLAAAVIQTLSTGKNKRKQEDSGDDASNTTDSAKKKAKDQQQQPYQPPNIEPAIPTPLGQSSTPSKTSSPQSTGPQTPPMVAAPSVQRLPIQSGQVARLPIPPLHPPQGVRSAAPSTSPQQQQQQQQRPQGQQPKPAGAPTSAPTTTTTTGQQQQQQPLRPIQQPQSQSHPPQPQQQQGQSQPQPQPRPPPPVQQRPVASANSNTTTASYVPTSTVITGLPPQQQPPTLPERSQPMQSLLFNIETQVHSMMEQQRIRLESEHQKQLMERDLERMKQNQKHDEEIRRYRSTLSRLSTAMSTLLGAVVPANDRELRKLADDATSSIMRMTNNLHSNSSNNSGNEYDSSGAEFDQAIMSLASALRQRTQQQQQQQQHHTQTQQPQSQQPQQPQPQPQPPIQQQPQDDTSSNSSISNLSLLTNLSAATAAALNAAASTNANNNNTLNNSNNNGGASNSR